MLSSAQRETDNTPYKSDTYYITQRRVGMAVAYGVLGVVVVLSLYPILLMATNAFKSSNENVLNPGGLPQQATLDNFNRIFSPTNGLVVYFWHTVLVAVVTTIVAVFLAAMAAFAFAKYRFPGRNVLFILLLATIMVPVEITLPPQYLTFANINWLDTFQVQIVPFIAPVFGLFWIRQYMLTIPDSLIEAARIDGANDWRIFWSLIMPLSRPALAVFGILHFLSMWNSYIWPQIMAKDPSVAPLMIILPNLRDSVIGFVPDWGLIMAGCVLATLPILVLFLFFRRQFIAGTVVGSVRE